MRGWLDKHDAISLVLRHQADYAIGSRSSAASTLRLWVVKGIVRTKRSKVRPPWAKHTPKLYRRSDLVEHIAKRTNVSGCQRSERVLEQRHGHMRR